MNDSQQTATSFWKDTQCKYQGLNARLQYLQCISTGDTVILHKFFKTFQGQGLLNFCDPIFLLGLILIFAKVSVYLLNPIHI